MTDKTIEAHKTIRHFTETEIVPEHIKRKESSDFRHSKERLKLDGHYKCYICGEADEEKLQVHHLGCEWSLQNVCDFSKLKEFLLEWDVYGYSRLLKNLEIKNADDIRNMLVLCSQHHISGSNDGASNGIHEITFPIWIMQKLSIDNENPIPQNSESPDEVLNEFKELKIINKEGEKV